MKLLMLGAPGAGKGTQAARVAEALHIPHISTGDLFRANIRNHTELGILAESYISKGQLVPDEVTINMLMSRLADEDCANGYILDGFPRTIPQAEALTGRTSLDCAINLDVKDEDIMNRMSGRRVCPKCGASYHIVSNPPRKEGICDVCGDQLIIREDDKAETVKNRLNVYHEQTAPLIDYYEKQGILKQVDGAKPMDEVTESVLRAIQE
ncbi:MAG: adenylate kinase [Firmicutes bacterium]|nr:adenylate kinase [Bacillota bacterium]